VDASWPLTSDLIVLEARGCKRSFAFFW